ncbi:NAD(P)H-hydrate dehydratase, partial [Chloroflexota bacterium]
YQFGYRDPLEDPAYSGVQQKNILCIPADDDSKFSNLEEVLASTDIVVDALLGPGDAEPMGDLRKGTLQRVSNAKNIRPQMLIIGLDIPSGLDPDTGAVDTSTLNCDLTITLGYPKVGLFLFPGASRVGKLTIADIGIPQEIATDMNTELITEDWACSSLPPRPLNANKTSFGRVLVIAGSINYVGAAYLSCMGAYRVGAGLVTLATPTSLVGPLLSKLTEVVFVPLTQSAAGIAAEDAFKDVKREVIASNVMLIGPGLGRGKAPQEFIKDTLGNLQPASSPNLVIDGDALDAIKEVDKWWKKLPKQMVLTPNSGELSRMLTVSIADIEKDRLSFAKKTAKEWDNTIVLKGAHTIIASFDGRTRICQSANPALASSGTGDVLGGLIAGLLGQGIGFFDAASLGVYLHAMAGELLREQFGDSGIIAGDLPLAIPRVMKRIRAELVSRAEPVVSSTSTSLWRIGGALS